MKVVCCGETLFDIIAEKRSADKTVGFRAFPGGSATNTSVILAKLGIPVALISHLGTGFLSDHLVDILKNRNVETRHIIRDRNFSAPLAFASIDKKGNSSYLFYEKSVYPESVKTRVSEALLRESSVFHTGSYFSYSETFSGFVRKMLKLAKKNGLFITYDPNWRETKIPQKRRARERIKKILPLVDLLKLSETDALTITGSRTLSGALAELRRHLKGDLVVTMGEKGSFYWDGKEKTEQSAFRVKVVDTIGAGDGFTAGLIYRFSKVGRERFKKEKEKNLEFASAVSALICSGAGAMGRLQHIEQVVEFIGKYGPAGQARIR